MPFYCQLYYSSYRTTLLLLGTEDHCNFLVCALCYLALHPPLLLATSFIWILPEYLLHVFSFISLNTFEWIQVDYPCTNMFHTHLTFYLQVSFVSYLITKHEYFLQYNLKEQNIKESFLNTTNCGFHFKVIMNGQNSVKKTHTDKNGSIDIYSTWSSNQTYENAHGAIQVLLWPLQERVCWQITVRGAYA